jgi:hypothetical protein
LFALSKSKRLNKEKERRKRASKWASGAITIFYPHMLIMGTMASFITH